MTAAGRERARLAALGHYRILDTPPEAVFDDIVAIAAQICDTPIALISFVDDRRQWFKASLGVSITETSREMAFCAHAIQDHGMFVVEDARADPRFADNPLVTGDPNVCFYAGAPLNTTDGFRLGTLCVLHHQPHSLDERQRKALAALGRQVMVQLDLRRTLQQRHDDEIRHQQILDSAIDYGIISMDLSGLVTSWNEGARRILGWTEEEMTGHPCDIFFTPEDRQAGVPAREMAAALSRGRGMDERWYVRKDATRFWAQGEMMALTDDEGTPVGLIKILRERTEQHRSRIALEVSERRFQLALAAADLGAWDASMELGDLVLDARSRSLLGFGEDEDAGAPLAFLSHVHPLDRTEVERLARTPADPDGEHVLDVEFRMTSPEGHEERWIHAMARRLDTEESPPRFIGTVRDISARKAAEQHQTLLTGELQHRIKNTLAVVQAIVSQSLRNVATPAEARAAIGERLATLSRAHDLLTQGSWTAAPIRKVIAGAIQLHSATPGTITMSGPMVRLNARAALALSMVIHELCTNAAKYGALSVQGGKVVVEWSVEGTGGEAMFTMIWRERGGPVVSAPTRKGFGTRLIETSLSGDLGGSCTLDYDPDGVCWTLHSCLADIREEQGAV